MITREALMVLENQLGFTKGVNRKYDDKFGIEGAKIGNTVDVRKPPRYIGRTGTDLAVEDVTETSVPVSLDTQFGVDINFTTADLLLDINDFSQRYIVPAVATVANKIDRDGLALYKNIANAVGTPGSTPSTLKTYLQAAALLSDEAAPNDGFRSAIINPDAEVELVDALKGLFNSQSDIAKQYQTGKMGMAGGMKFTMDQNVVAHTVGPQGGTPLVDGASQTGATLSTKGWTAVEANRLKEGDTFTIAGVYAVNPQSRQSTGKLRRFVVTEDADSTAGGLSDISISPAIVATGAFQNVSNTAADSAVITVLGSSDIVSPANMVYHRDAFTLAVAPLPVPRGVDMAASVSDSQLGVGIRMVRQYDINTDKMPCRLDVLYGWSTIYQELACRVHG